MKTTRLVPGIIALIMLFSMNETLAQQWANNGNHIYNTNTGNVGIGTGTSFSPTSKLHINNGTIVADIMCESAYSGTSNHSVGNLRLKNSTTGDMFNVTLRKNGTVDEMLQSCYDASASLWREFIYYNFGTRKYEMRTGVMDAEFKNSGNLLFSMTGKVGIRTTTPDATVDIYTNSYNRSRLGYNNTQCNFFEHWEDPANGDGQATVYGFRDDISEENQGVDYSSAGSNSAVKGLSADGAYYSFGMAGFTNSSWYRYGGVLGAHTDGSVWGSLGYRSGGGTHYGGYFTSYTSGSGKNSQPALEGIGMGSWGDLFGADIHGKIYGVYAEGENYAIYSHGITYKDDLDVHLQGNGTKTKTVLYTNTSTEVTVQTSGIAQLSNGRASIKFDEAFVKSISAQEPIIVTVTPLGSSNGVFLSDITNTGFTIMENNAGKSNVTVNFIAIGKRAGYEKPQLASEVIDAAYVSKLSRGLHNDSDLETNGEGLYYENGQLVVGVHPSALPDPNKPNEKF
jgi:hypothetical protein